MDILGYGEESVSVAMEEVKPQDWAERVYTPDIRNKWDKVYKKPGYDIKDLETREEYERNAENRIEAVLGHSGLAHWDRPCRGARPDRSWRVETCRDRKKRLAKAQQASVLGSAQNFVYTDVR